MIIKDLFGNVLTFEYSGSMTKDEHEILTRYEKKTATILLIVEPHIFEKTENHIIEAIDLFITLHKKVVFKFVTNSAIAFFTKEKLSDEDVNAFIKMLHYNIQL